ncbi:hypothetical protein PT277_06120 [Acetobacteraceae bacterium ESL0709]|nr:hypothetical protein [Acetobacteraceae bacterium ESL0697]MDF7678275.1 hypothetical protein [Acetobacteraceae bacterium ESL0709]
MTAYMYIMGFAAPSSGARTQIPPGIGGVSVRLFLFRKYRKRILSALLSL